MTTCSSDEVRLSTTELCDPCFSNCKEILAVLYCLDCDVKFCEVCGTCHKKSKLSKDHKLSKVAEAPPGKIVKLLKELTTCPNHQSEEVVYICIDEDQLFCSQCANTRHRKCRQLETIEQYMVTAKHEQTITHPMTYAPQEKSGAEENHVRIIRARQNCRFRQLEENLAQRSYYSYGAYPNPQVTRNIQQMHQVERPDGETSAAKNILPEKTVHEKLNQLDQQLAEILKHDANERSLVDESVARVTDYLQNVQAKLESAVNFLKTEVISQSEMQNRVLLQNFDTRQTNITYLRDQISTDRDNIDAIKQHGNDRHVFLLRRKITKEIRDIESRTQQLNQSKVASNIAVVEQTPVDNIVRTIKGALRVQTNVRGAEDYG